MPPSAFAMKLAGVAQGQHDKFHPMNEADPPLCAQIKKPATAFRLGPTDCVKKRWSALFVSSRGRARAVRRVGLIFLIASLSACTALAQVRCRRSVEIYSVQLDDPVEAALIEQELKITPVKMVGRRFYYYGDPRANAALRQFGYDPVRRDPNEIVSTLMLMGPTKDSAEAGRLGLVVLIREPRYWIVRVTPKQSQALSSRGYTLRPLGRAPLYPRQIRINTADFKDVQRASELDVDIYSVRPVRGSYVIEGSAFDHVIDKLRAAGMTVEVLPDPPGVIR